MTIEDNITCVYAAKKIAPFLHVTPPPMPKEVKSYFFWRRVEEGIMSTIEGVHSAYLYCTDKEAYAQKIAYQQRSNEARDEMLEWRRRQEEELENELRAAGIATEQERNAWTVANGTSVYLSILVRYDGYGQFSWEMTKGWTDKHGQRWPKEVRTDRETLGKMVDMALISGIATLEEQYGRGWPGVTQQIINLDFKEEAKKVLLDEIDARIAQFTLLEKVYLLREGDKYNVGLMPRNEA
ncbi:hypothetical protein HY639_03745 [Candidatus Woesearchaeota archaeon]|nr:hypothetical protein [Candidatus Woesearchaeota archaeon]